MWFEVGETMDAVIAREKQVKRYRREWKRNLIERENPMWNDLAVGLTRIRLRISAVVLWSRGGVVVFHGQSIWLLRQKNLV